MTDSSSQEQLDKFLLTEYNNISQALFSTSAAITQFFQYYLLILGIPLTAAGLLKGTVSVALAELKSLGLFPVAVAFVAVIALVGFCMLAYISNLRLDLVLYARTVNGIRKRFYDEARLRMDVELWIRTLPKTVHQPRYLESRYFAFVVLAFGLMDSVYALGALLLWAPAPRWLLYAMTLAFLASHFGVYMYLVHYREHRYLRTHIIGVDIDGVLGEHRTAFAKVLEEVVAKKIDPEKITRIPVHECLGLGVTQTDEYRVFNTPRYWATMGAYPSTAKRIRELKDVFGFDVHIFTYRPWPLVSHLGQDDEEAWLRTLPAIQQGVCRSIS